MCVCVCVSHQQAHHTVNIYLLYSMYTHLLKQFSLSGPAFISASFQTLGVSRGNDTCHTWPFFTVAHEDITDTSSVLKSTCVTHGSLFCHKSALRTKYAIELNTALTLQQVWTESKNAEHLQWLFFVAHLDLTNLNNYFILFF